MTLDPISVLLGVPVLGPIVAYLLLELKDVRKSMEAREARIVEAYLTNAAALTKLEDMLDRVKESQGQFMDVLRRVLEKD